MVDSLEYLREPPDPTYRYPLSHVHVNAQLRESDNERSIAKPLERLHLPTGRVPLELIIGHLVAEWGVAAKTDDYPLSSQNRLRGFENRRTSP